MSFQVPVGLTIGFAVVLNSNQRTEGAMRSFGIAIVVDPAVVAGTAQFSAIQVVASASQGNDAECQKLP